MERHWHLDVNIKNVGSDKIILILIITNKRIVAARLFMCI
jgi:hypothetical protein